MSSATVMPGRNIIKSPTTQITPITKEQPPKAKPAADYQAQVKQFRDNVPALESQLFQGAANQSRNQLAGQLADIRQNAASRGLLYGGLREGAEQGARAGAAGDLAAKRFAINQAVEGQANDFDSNALNRLMEQYRAEQEANQQQYGMNLQRRGLEQAQQGQLFGGLLGTAALAAPFLISDETKKENVSKEDGEISELYKHIRPETYSYKDEENGEGKHLSPMAQDLEKSEIGKSMVEDTPHGKVVNMGKGFGAMMSMQKALDTRLKKLEARD